MSQHKTNPNDILVDILDSNKKYRDNIPIIECNIKEENNESESDDFKILPLKEDKLLYKFTFAICYTASLTVSFAFTTVTGRKKFKISECI